MIMTLKRRAAVGKCTFGDLYLDGVFECYTLEDLVHGGPKIPGQTAIPAGKYEVQVTWSPRFQRALPELVAVPGFEGIRIHVGNWPEDTDGCILVGSKIGNGMILQSRMAFDKLFPKIQAPCWINVMDFENGTS